MCKDTGLGSFPLQGDAANRIWRLVMTLVCEILACSQKLSLTGIPAHKWEPRMIRLRLMKYSTVIRPPHPPRNPALQGRTLLGRPPPRRVESLSDTTFPLGAQPCSLSTTTPRKNSGTRKDSITTIPDMRQTVVISTCHNRARSAVNNGGLRPLLRLRLARGCR